MKNPSISVVMSVYNNADTLSIALDSILSQDGVELEFIVIDDGSTDGSGKILDDVAARDSRLEVVHKENEGLTRALIEGCAMASAPWIARQDADDVSLPGRLRAQLERALEKDAPILVACGVLYRTPAGETMFPVIPSSEPKELKDKILEHGENACSHGAIVFSRECYEAVGGYRSEFYFAQDLDLVTRLAEAGRVGSVQAVLYWYTFSPHSISTHSAAVQAMYRKLIRAGHEVRMRGGSDMESLEKAKELCQAVREGGCPKSDPFPGYYFIGACLQKRDPRVATHYFRKAVLTRPWSSKSWVRWLAAVVASVRAPSTGESE
jgi:glycosyltransferase involved in cell wall biosynthesis